MLIVVETEVNLTILNIYLTIHILHYTQKLDLQVVKKIK